MNPLLPIFPFKKQIVDSVANNQAIVIIAETGAGKSTQTPQYLLDAGYNIVVTQPRRVAARTLAARVAEEMGQPLGQTVGYRTAYEAEDSPGTKLLYCTDGLALVRELMGTGTHDLLIIDELHEWNQNVETLLGWSLFHIKNRPLFRVVLMSATIEAERLSRYFLNAPIIEVPGRSFPITEQKPKNFLSDIKRLVKEKRNVLVFQPGKAEINDTLVQLQDLDAEILPLHGDLTIEEQDLCFKNYGRPKVVVSTNVAQTSITIDDIDAVVDSGMEKRIELSDGVEGLYLRPISLSDSEQRKGRSGRTKPGIYINHCPVSDRPRFPTPEILRRHLDQTVLRLAEAGFDMEELPFFHQPEISQIRAAKKTLKTLGCFDKKGNVTKLGQDIALLPVSVRYARMILEADTLGVVEDVVKVASIMEAGDLTQRRNFMWRTLIRGENKSDVFAQLHIFEAARKMDEEERASKGIHEKSFLRAVEIFGHLSDVVKSRVSVFNSSGNRDDIMKSVISGMVDCLYRCDHFDYYINAGGLDRREDEDDCYEDARELSHDSVVKSSQWIVALAFDLHIDGRFGEKVLRLLRMASAVDTGVLIKLAPHLLKEEKGHYEYDPGKDVCYSVVRRFFNGLEIPSHRNKQANSDHASLGISHYLASEILGHGKPSHDVFQSLIKVARKNLKTARKSKQLTVGVNTESLAAVLHTRLNGLSKKDEIVRNYQAFSLPFKDEEFN